MLVLSRSIGESVVIEGVGTVTIVAGGRAGRAKIGFDLAPEFRIRRAELPERKLTADELRSPALV